MLQIFVDGHFVDVDATNPIMVLNPATGKAIAICPDTPCNDVEYAVAAAKRAPPGVGEVGADSKGRTPARACGRDRRPP